MQEIVTKIMPIFIFIILGYVLRITKTISEEDILSVKKIIVKIAIPILLFKVFLDMELRSEYLLVVGISIIFFLLAYLAGRVISKTKAFQFELLPFITTGFAFGLLAVPLFQIMFGENNLGSIAVLGIAQELFVWIILITLVKFDLNNEKFTKKTLVNVMKTPLIICVFTALILNVLSLDIFIRDNFILRGIYDAIGTFTGIVTPLMLIIIGYGLVFNRKYLKDSFKYISVRFLVLFIIGYTMKFLLLDRIIDDVYFNYAFFTLLILPPNIGILIVASDYCEKEKYELANSITALGIILFIVLFVIYSVIVTI